MAEREILVEGANDKHVLWAIAEKGGLSLAEGTIVDSKGKAGVFETFRVKLRTQSNLKSIGLLLDADEHPSLRWREVTKVLSEQGCFDIPTDPPPEGLVCELNGRTIGVWLAPNNVTPGAIEDVFLSLLTESDSLLPFARRYVDEIPEEQRRFRPIDREKAHAYAWLAVQAKPGRPMGETLRKSGFVCDLSPVTELLKWVRRVTNTVD